MHSQQSQHPSDAPTVLVPPPPPKTRRAAPRRFEYQGSEAPLDLSDHVERALSGEDRYPTAAQTRLEPEELTRKLRRIYLRIFGKGGMIL